MSGGLAARLGGLGDIESNHWDSCPSGIATMGTGASCVVTTTREGVLTTLNLGLNPRILRGVDGVDEGSRGRGGTGTDVNERGRAVGVPGSLNDLLDMVILVGIGRAIPFIHGERAPGTGTTAGGWGNDIRSNAEKLSVPLVTLAEGKTPSLLRAWRCGSGCELLDRPCEVLRRNSDTLDDEYSLVLDRTSTDAWSAFECVESMACALFPAALMLWITSAQHPWSGNGIEVGVGGREGSS